MSTRMAPHFEHFWRERSPSERKLLVAWVLLVACALLYAFVLSPLSQGIARLKVSVPRLEAELFSMRSQTLPGTLNSSATAASNDLRSALFQILAREKIKADVRSISANRVELRLPEMPMGNALALVEKIRQETLARVENLSITNGAPGGPALLVFEMERAS